MTSPCLNVGSHGVGPFTSSQYFEQDSAFRAAWANRADFSVGGFFYFNTLGSGGTFNTIFSATNLSGNEYALFAMGDGSLLYWYQNGVGFYSPTGTVTTGVCYYIGMANSSSGGKDIWASPANAISQTPVVHNANTNGTGAQAYVILGRYFNGCCPLNGYANDVTFWTSYKSTVPFDGNIPAPTATVTPTTGSHTPTMTLTPTPTYTMTQVISGSVIAIMQTGDSMDQGNNPTDSPSGTDNMGFRPWLIGDLVAAGKSAYMVGSNSFTSIWLNLNRTDAVSGQTTATQLANLGGQLAANFPGSGSNRYVYWGGGIAGHRLSESDATIGANARAALTAIDAYDNTIGIIVGNQPYSADDDCPGCRTEYLAAYNWGVSQGYNMVLYFDSFTARGGTSAQMATDNIHQTNVPNRLAGIALAAQLGPLL